MPRRRAISALGTPCSASVQTCSAFARAVGFRPRNLLSPSALAIPSRRLLSIISRLPQFPPCLSWLTDFAVEMVTQLKAASSVGRGPMSHAAPADAWSFSFPQLAENARRAPGGCPAGINPRSRYGEIGSGPARADAVRPERIKPRLNKLVNEAGGGGRTGCTKSSSMAIAFTPDSTAARSGC